MKISEAEKHSFLFCMTPENGVRRAPVVFNLINRKAIIKKKILREEGPMRENSAQARLVLFS